MKEQRELNIMQHNWQVTRLLIRQGSVIFGSGLGFGLRGIPKHPHAKKKKPTRVTGTLGFVSAVI